MHADNVMQRKTGVNLYVSAALARPRISSATLAQKPQVFERALKQQGQESPAAADSCLTMPLLGKIWRDMTARLT